MVDALSASGSIKRLRSIQAGAQPLLHTALATMMRRANGLIPLGAITHTVATLALAATI